MNVASTVSTSRFVRSRGRAWAGAACLLLAGMAQAGVPGHAVEKGQPAGKQAPKGWIMVRAGAANTSANYAKEERDINGKLQQVSVLCAPAGTRPEDLVATDRTRTWNKYMQGRVTSVVNYGGVVLKDPLRNNPRHCLINGLALRQIKGIWHEAPGR